MEPQPEIAQGHILVPDRPGIGVDIVEEAIAKYPSSGNVSPRDGPQEYVYFRARDHRAQWLNI